MLISSNKFLKIELWDKICTLSGLHYTKTHGTKLLLTWSTRSLLNHKFYNWFNMLISHLYICTTIDTVPHITITVRFIALLIVALYMFSTWWKTPVSLSLLWCFFVPGTRGWRCNDPCQSVWKLVPQSWIQALCCRLDQVGCRNGFRESCYFWHSLFLLCLASNTWSGKECSVKIRLMHVDLIWKCRNSIIYICFHIHGHTNTVKYPPCMYLSWQCILFIYKYVIGLSILFLLLKHFSFIIAWS